MSEHQIPPLTDDELRVLWGGCRALLAWVPTIEPNRVYLESLYKKVSSMFAEVPPLPEGIGELPDFRRETPSGRATPAPAADSTPRTASTPAH